MSQPSPPTTDSSATPNAEQVAPVRRTVRQALAVIRPSAQFASFWLAIALPFVYIPLLIHGLASATAALTFLGLVFVNVLALYVGHGYNRY